jgi:hypothetical protein
MKIGDYSGKLDFFPIRDKNAVLKKKADLDGPRPFDEILSGYRSSQAKSGKLNPRGLKISDYLANPVKTFYYAPPRGAESSDQPTVRDSDLVLDILKSLTQQHSSEWKVFNENPTRTHPVSPHEVEKDVCDNSGNVVTRQKILKSIDKAAAKYRLPPSLLRGVVKAESDFQVHAVSSAGAQGLMQLMPGTAKELGVTDPFDIDQSIDGGARYLRKMLDMFGGDVKKALAAYNAGPGTVKRYDGKVPYKETIHYVQRVLKFSGQRG